MARNTTPAPEWAAVQQTWAAWVAAGAPYTGDLWVAYTKAAIAYHRAAGTLVEKY